MQKYIENFFVLLLYISLFAPFFFFQELLFPYITSKAFYFRVVIELILPFYVYLIAANKNYRPSLKNPLVISLILFLLASLISSVFGINVARSLWGNFERMGGVFYLAHLILLVFYILLLGRLKKEGGQRFSAFIIAALPIGLMLFGFLTFAGLPAFKAIASILGVLGISLLVLRFSQNLLRGFFELMVFIALLTVVNGIFNKLGWIILYPDSSLPARVSSVFGNPIFFASFLILPLSLALYFGVSEEKLWKKIYYYLSSALMFFGIYQSGTRGALVGIIAAVLIAGGLYLFFSLKQGKSKKIFLGVFAAFLLLMFLGFAFSKKLPEGNMRRIFNLNDANTQSRLIQWKVALKGFKDAPLLGTGPENYFLTAEKYYDPKIYQYDAAWFDKPHNYFLEILVTGGIVGFLPFLAIVAFVPWLLFRAYKDELLSLAEFCLLLGGFIAYNVQNLFVFDTVGASIVFFGFLGFVAYMRQQAENVKEAQAVASQNPQAKKAFSFPSAAAGGVVAAGVLYLLYATNFVPFEIGRNVQLGHAYSMVDYRAAAGYFEKAKGLPFNFDELETAGRYADYAEDLTKNNEAGKDLDFVKRQINQAYTYQKEVAENSGGYTLAFLRLGKIQIIEDVINQRQLGQETEAPIRRAMEFAPNRFEPWQLLLQLKGQYLQDFKATVEIAEKIVNLNPYRTDLKFQLGIAYAKDGQMDKGANLALEAVEQGYRPQELAQFYWAANHFFGQKEYAKAIPLMELAASIEPNNLDNFFLLAESYAKIGEKEKAAVMARMIAKLNPSIQAVVEEFLNTLK